MFGLIPGWANLTGWALVGILIIMVLCSLPCVRKSGSFEVTHLKCWVTYFDCLLMRYVWTGILLDPLALHSLLGSSDSPWTKLLVLVYWTRSPFSN